MNEMRNNLKSCSSYHCEFNITQHEAGQDKMETDVLHLEVDTTAETHLSSLPTSQQDLKKLNKENLSAAVR